MAFIRPEIARLTLTYLERENYLRTFEVFREECPFLIEFRNMLPRNPTSESVGGLGFSLLEIFEDYNRCISLVRACLFENGMDLRPGDGLSTSLERALSLSCKCSKETSPTTISGYFPNHNSGTFTSTITPVVRTSITEANASLTSNGGVAQYHLLKNVTTRAVNNNYAVRNDLDSYSATLMKVNTVIIPQHKYDFGQPGFSAVATQAVEYNPLISNQPSFAVSNTALVGVNSIQNQPTQFFQPPQPNNMTGQSFECQRSVRTLTTFEGQPVFATSVASLVGLNAQLQQNQIVPSQQICNETPQAYAYQHRMNSYRPIPPASTWVNMGKMTIQTPQYQSPQLQHVFSGTQKTQGCLPLRDNNDKILPKSHEVGSRISSQQSVVSTREYPAAHSTKKPVSAVTVNAMKLSMKRKLNEVAGSQDTGRKLVRIAPMIHAGRSSTLPATNAYVQASVDVEPVIHPNLPSGGATAQLSLNSNTFAYPLPIPSRQNLSNTIHTVTIPPISLNSMTVAGLQSVASPSIIDLASSSSPEASEGIAGRLIQLLTPFKDLPHPIPLPIPNIVSISNVSHKDGTPESLEVNSVPVTNLPNPVVPLASDISFPAYEAPETHATRMSSTSETIVNAKVGNPENLESNVALQVTVWKEGNNLSASTVNASVSENSGSLKNMGGDKLESYVCSLVSLPIPLSMTEDHATSSGEPILRELLRSNSNTQNTQESGVMNVPNPLNLATQPAALFSHVPSAGCASEGCVHIVASPENVTTTKMNTLDDRKMNVISEANALGEASGNDGSLEEIVIPEKWTTSASPSNSQSDKAIPCTEPSLIPYARSEYQEKSVDPNIANQKLIQLSDAEWKQLRKLMARPRVNLERIPAKWESELRDRGFVSLSSSTRRSNRVRRKKYYWFS